MLLFVDTGGQDNKRNSRIPGPCQTLNENWWQTIFSVRLRRGAHPAVRRGSGIGFNLSNHGWRNCVRENTNAHLPARGLRLVLGGMLGSIGVTLTEACTTGNETANNGAKAGRWWWQFFVLRFWDRKNGPDVEKAAWIIAADPITMVVTHFWVVYTTFCLDYFCFFCNRKLKPKF